MSIDTPAPEPDKEPAKKEQLGEANAGVPSRPKLTEQQELMASRYVTINYSSGNLYYANTLIERIADGTDGTQPADTVMTGLHVTICKQLVDEYQRDGHLSKNSHRRLTQVIHMYRMDIALQCKCDTDAAIEQAHILDRYSEVLSKNFRASRIEGNVETVESFPDTIEKRRKAAVSTLLRKDGKS